MQFVECIVQQTANVLMATEDLILTQILPSKA